MADNQEPLPGKLIDPFQKIQDVGQHNIAPLPRLHVTQAGQRQKLQVPVSRYAPPRQWMGRVFLPGVNQARYFQ